jgi:hypothetical protein
MIDGQVVLYCKSPCRAHRPHRLARFFQRRSTRWEEAIFLCVECRHATKMTLTHFAYERNCTACALPWERIRVTSDKPAEVNCPDCVFMLFAELGGAPTPDWRPEVVLSEDFYAA